MKFCSHSRAIMLMIFSLAAFAASSDEPEIPPNFMENPGGAINSLQEAVANLKREKERMRNEISDLQTRLNNRPEGFSEIEKTFTNASNESFVNPITDKDRKKSVCPSGQVMVGIEITGGENCGGMCKSDGLPLHSFRIQCAPVIK